MGTKGVEKNKRLRFKGELTVVHAEEIRKQLLESLESSQQVEVEFEDVTNIDLSCLQLLCSAHRSASESGKKLTLIKPDGLLFDEVKKTAGFTVGNKCIFNLKNSCLWQEE